MTYRECYEKGCLALQTAGIEEATLDARLLLEAVCGTNRNDLLVHGEQSVTPEAEEKYLGWIGQRAEHIPLQQLTGEQDFMGLTFAVNEHVRIPYTCQAPAFRHGVPSILPPPESPYPVSGSVRAH